MGADFVNYHPCAGSLTKTARSFSTRPSSHLHHDDDMDPESLAMPLAYEVDDDFDDDDVFDDDDLDDDAFDDDLDFDDDDFDEDDIDFDEDLEFDDDDDEF